MVSVTWTHQGMVGYLAE